MNEREREEFFKWMKRIKSITIVYDGSKETLNPKKNGDGMDIKGGDKNSPGRHHWTGRIRRSGNPQLILKNRESGLRVKVKVPKSSTKLELNSQGEKILLNFQIS